MAYADAVRDEILDLFGAGADVVEVDETYMHARPEAARDYRLDLLRRATDGIAGTTAIHICSGYAASIHDRPSGCSFLAELAATECGQIGIETTQSGLALDVLDALSSKTIILGVLDLSTDEVETAETVTARIRRALPHAGPNRLIAAPDCGTKYMPRDARLRQARGPRRGRSPRRRGISITPG